jgi:hypothetical protein
MNEMYKGLWLQFWFAQSEATGPMGKTRDRRDFINLNLTSLIPSSRENAEYI